jgi:hypothetical protein
MVKFGAILDLNSRLIYLRPTRPGETVAAGVKAILTRQGWSPINLSLAHLHLRVPAKINDVPCHLMVDTGSYLTTLDRSFAARAKIGGTPTEWTAYGIGKSGGGVKVASFASMWISNYQIKHASASVVTIDPEMLSRGTDLEIEGLLGAEYLSLNSAVFDFISGTLYMRPRSH